MTAEGAAAAIPVPAGERRPVGRPPGLRALGAGPVPVSPNLSAQPLTSQNSNSVEEPSGDARMEATNAGSTKRPVEDVDEGHDVRGVAGATRGSAAVAAPPGGGGPPFAATFTPTLAIPSPASPAAVVGAGNADTLLERMAELASDKSAAKTLAGIMPRMEAVEIAQKTCANDIDVLKQGQTEIIKQLQDMKTRAASSASTTVSSGAGLDVWRNQQQQGSDYQPSTIEIKGFANFDNVNTAGIEFMTLLQWIDRFTSLAPKEMVERFDIEYSKGEQYQGGWPRYLAIKLKLRDPIKGYHGRELCRELREIFLTDASANGAMQLNNVTLNAYAETSPERKPIKVALGRAMAGLRSFGIDTQKNVRATFPRSGPYITTLWDMTAHPPDVVANLHPAGWEIMPIQMRKLCGSEPDVILAAMR